MSFFLYGIGEGLAGGVDNAVKDSREEDRQMVLRKENQFEETLTNYQKTMQDKNAKLDMARQVKARNPTLPNSIISQAVNNAGAEASVEDIVGRLNHLVPNSQMSPENARDELDLSDIGAEVPEPTFELPTRGGGFGGTLGSIFSVGLSEDQADAFRSPYLERLEQINQSYGVTPAVPAGQSTPQRGPDLTPEQPAQSIAQPNVTPAQPEEIQRGLTPRQRELNEQLGYPSETDFGLNAPELPLASNTLQSGGIGLQQNSSPRREAPRASDIRASANAAVSAITPTDGVLDAEADRASSQAAINFTTTAINAFSTSSVNESDVTGVASEVSQRYLDPVLSSRLYLSDVETNEAFDGVVTSELGALRSKLGSTQERAKLISDSANRDKLEPVLSEDKELFDTLLSRYTELGRTNNERYFADNKSVRAQDSYESYLKNFLTEEAIDEIKTRYDIQEMERMADAALFTRGDLTPQEQAQGLANLEASLSAMQSATGQFGTTDRVKRIKNSFEKFKSGRFTDAIPESFERAREVVGEQEEDRELITEGQEEIAPGEGFQAKLDFTEETLGNPSERTKQAETLVSAAGKANSPESVKRLIDLAKALDPEIEGKIPEGLLVKNNGPDFIDKNLPDLEADIEEKLMNERQELAREELGKEFEAQATGRGISSSNAQRYLSQAFKESTLELPPQEYIIENEGYSPRPYADSGRDKKLTVGYGFNLEDPANEEILRSVIKDEQRAEDLLNGDGRVSREEADKLLETTYKRSEEEVSELVDNFESMPEQVKKVLVDLSFNLGITRLSQFKKTLGLIEDRNFIEAGKELLRSNYATQVKRRALNNAFLISTADSS